MTAWTTPTNKLGKALLAFLALASCKQTTTSEFLGDDTPVATKPFTFTLEMQENRFKIGNFTQEAPGQAADLAINLIEFLPANPKAEFAVGADPVFSDEGSYVLTLFYRPDFQQCLPKDAVKLGVKSEGACVSFKTICEYNGWGLFNESAGGASPSCSCKTGTITVADFRNSTALKPLCDADRREPLPPATPTAMPTATPSVTPSATPSASSSPTKTP